MHVLKLPALNGTCHAHIPPLDRKELLLQLASPCTPPQAACPLSLKPVLRLSAPYKMAPLQVMQHLCLAGLRRTRSWTRSGACAWRPF